MSIIKKINSWYTDNIDTIVIDLISMWEKRCFDKIVARKVIERRNVK